RMDEGDVPRRDTRLDEELIVERDDGHDLPAGRHDAADRRDVDTLDDTAHGRAQGQILERKTAALHDLRERFHLLARFGEFLSRLHHILRANVGLLELELGLLALQADNLDVARRADLEQRLRDAKLVSNEREGIVDELERLGETASTGLVEPPFRREQVGMVVELLREDERLLPDFGLEPCDPRERRAVARGAFLEIRGRACRIELGEHLAGLDDIVLGDLDARQDTTLERLDRLLAHRRDDASGPGCHLVEAGKVRPYEKREEAGRDDPHDARAPLETIVIEIAVNPGFLMSGAVHRHDRTALRRATGRAASRTEACSARKRALAWSLTRRPASTTSTRSTRSRMRVRCVAITTVRPSLHRPNCSTKWRSVSSSIAAVGSSRSRMVGSRSRRRASSNACTCPPESPAPPSRMRYSRPR